MSCQQATTICKSSAWHKLALQSHHYHWFCCHGQQATTAVKSSDPSAGSRWLAWGRPVRAKVTGAFTLSALEGRGGRDSPQTLVTAIMRADFGGWLSHSSIFYRASRVRWTGVCAMLLCSKVYSSVSGVCVAQCSVMCDVRACNSVL